eukprot:4182030-Lingulodinium_polyedra.AAC.1
MDSHNGNAWAFVEVDTEAEGERVISALPAVGMATENSLTRGREWRCLEAEWSSDSIPGSRGGLTLPRTASTTTSTSMTL